MINITRSRHGRCLFQMHPSLLETAQKGSASHRRSYIHKSVPPCKCFGRASRGNSRTYSLYLTPWRTTPSRSLDRDYGTYCIGFLLSQMIHSWSRSREAITRTLHSHVRQLERCRSLLGTQQIDFSVDAPTPTMGLSSAADVDDIPPLISKGNSTERIHLVLAGMARVESSAQHIYLRTDWGTSYQISWPSGARWLEAR